MKRLFILSLLLSIAAIACADELNVGSKAPGFALVNAVDGKTYSLADSKDKLSVVVFTCNQCPYAKAFEPRLIEIAKQYQPKGVVFYAINPNDDERYSEETMDNLKARATTKGYPFPYLKDGNSAVAKAYGARVTPHVFLVDNKGVVRYRGYIDDSAKPGERTNTGLTNALDALLSNKEVAETSTRAFGCTIKWKS